MNPVFITTDNRRKQHYLKEGYSIPVIVNSLVIARGTKYRSSSRKGYATSFVWLASSLITSY